MQQERKVSVLFVCMGNICRSPAADIVFRQNVRQGSFLLGLRRQEQILEKECGQLSAARQVRFAVHGHGVLADRTLAPAEQRRDFLVAVPLQEKEGHLALGRRQVPEP